MPAPAAPWLAPDPGRVWIAGGPQAAPGSLGALRTAALFTGREAAAPPLAAAREVTLVPAAAPAPPLADTLAWLRSAAPEAVLRLELWCEAKAAPDLAAAEVAALRSAQPLFVHAVLTRGGALPEGLAETLRRLAEAGVPTAAELVLARGALDAPDAVRALCLALHGEAVRPYFLVDGAWLPPQRRVARAAVLEIARALRGWISGLAVPQAVEEGAEGRRVPVIPPYVRQLDADGVEVVNYEGRRLRYANPPEEPGR